eukprot:14538004-Alexandrium_andersonii.AAC.1
MLAELERPLRAQRACAPQGGGANAPLPRGAERTGPEARASADWTTALGQQHNSASIGAFRPL